MSGSGLYVRALTHGFNAAPPPDAKLREELSSLSLEELGLRLQNKDPELAARVDLKNRRRLTRANEIAAVAAPLRGAWGRGVPSGKAGTCASHRDTATTNAPRGVFLVRDREELYARINERVEAMFRAGVEQEVAALIHIGPTAAQALGLREIQQLIAGEISRAECIARIQQKTRHYAKRQLTWFRRQTTFPQLNLTALSHSQAVSAITQAMAAE